MQSPALSRLVQIIEEKEDTWRAELQGSNASVLSRIGIAYNVLQTGAAFRILRGHLKHVAVPYVLKPFQ